MKRKLMLMSVAIGLTTLTGYRCYTQAQQTGSNPLLLNRNNSGLPPSEEASSDRPFLGNNNGPGNNYNSGTSPFFQSGDSINGSRATSPPVPPAPAWSGSNYSKNFSSPTPNASWVGLRDGKYVIESSDKGMDAESAKAYQAAMRQMEEAVKTIRSDSRSSEDIAEAKQQISQYLKVQFESDLERRRTQISSLEEQVEKLKKQVQKRAASMGELIELRMKLLENESQGLGFPQAWTTHSVFGSEASSANISFIPNSMGGYAPYPSSHPGFSVPPPPGTAMYPGPGRSGPVNGPSQELATPGVPERAPMPRKPKSASSH